MAYCCKGECVHITSVKKGMINIKPSLAYMVGNRCSICSDVNESIWFLKWVKSCPCCGTTLRRKSKHSLGREKVTLYLKENPLINS